MKIRSATRAAVLASKMLPSLQRAYSCQTRGCSSRLMTPKNVCFLLLRSSIQRLESRVFRTRAKIDREDGSTSLYKVHRCPFNTKQVIAYHFGWRTDKLGPVYGCVLLIFLVIPSNRWLYHALCPGQTRNLEKSKSKSGFSGTEPENPKSRKVEKWKTCHFSQKGEKYHF